MTRGVTVRTLDKLRAFCQKLLGVNNSLLEDGKDDAAMVLWAKSALGGADGTPGLNRMAYEVAAEWTGGR